MKFEWDPRKAETNLRKHGVSFDEAASVFLDCLALSGSEPDHSISELQYITLGMSRLSRLLVVSHTHRPDAIGIINARRMTRSERRLHEEG